MVLFTLPYVSAFHAGTLPHTHIHLHTYIHHLSVCPGVNTLYDLATMVSSLAHTVLCCTCLMHHRFIISFLLVVLYAWCECGVFCFFFCGFTFYFLFLFSLLCTSPMYMLPTSLYLNRQRHRLTSNAYLPVTYAASSGLLLTLFIGFSGSALPSVALATRLTGCLLAALPRHVRGSVLRRGPVTPL